MSLRALNLRPVGARGASERASASSCNFFVSFTRDLPDCAPLRDYGLRLQANLKFAGSCYPRTLTLIVSSLLGTVVRHSGAVFAFSPGHHGGGGDSSSPPGM